MPHLLVPPLPLPHIHTPHTHFVTFFPWFRLGGPPGWFPNGLRWPRPHRWMPCLLTPAPVQWMLNGTVVALRSGTRRSRQPLGGVSVQPQAAAGNRLWRVCGRNVACLHLPLHLYTWRLYTPCAARPHDLADDIVAARIVPVTFTIVVTFGYTTYRTLVGIHITGVPPTFARHGNTLPAHTPPHYATTPAYRRPLYATTGT